MDDALARIPIRLRLTAAFALAMATVLLALGYFLAEQLESNLTNAIDQGLLSRADAVAAEGPEGQIGSGGGPGARSGDTAQLLGLDGTVLASSIGLTRPLLSAAQTRAMPAKPTYLELRDTQAGGGPTRILAYRTRFEGRPMVVAVGSSVQPLRDARNQLIGLLLIGGPLALVLASGLGYAVAAAALRPVERMRAQAAAITADDERRLTIPPAKDELHALSETLNGMLDRLQHALDRERAFTMDASHELRTPLAVLKAELEVALRPQRTREEHIDALRSASEETDRLSRLAEDLLVLARSEQTGLPLRAEWFEADDLVQRVVARFVDLAAGHGVLIDARPAGAVRVHGDRDRLEQALGNLVANAVNHAASTVVVAAERMAGGGVIFTVDDDGEGFPEAFLAHAFDRFSQSDASRRSPGTGLGLAIVEAIATAHGGHARVENRTSGGARASVTITNPEEHACAS